MALQKEPWDCVENWSFDTDLVFWDSVCLMFSWLLLDMLDGFGSKLLGASAKRISGENKFWNLNGFFSEILKLKLKIIENWKIETRQKIK